MKKLLMYFLLSSVALADVPVPPAASPSEVIAGTLTSKYISPATAQFIPGVGGPTNGQTASQVAIQIEAYAATGQVYSAITAITATNAYSAQVAAGYIDPRLGITNFTTAGGVQVVSNTFTHLLVASSDTNGVLTVPQVVGNVIGSVTTATNALGFSSLGTTNIYVFGSGSAQSVFLDTENGNRETHIVNNYGDVWYEYANAGQFVLGIDSLGNSFGNAGFVYGVYPQYGTIYSLPTVPTNLISFKYNLFNDSAENILRLYGAEYFQYGLSPGDQAYPSGYTISSYFPFNGGSASAMDDLPPSPVAVANNMPMPVFRFANYAGNTLQFTNWVQAQITNTLPKISTVHNFLTNNGVTTVCFIDCYWDAAHRDSGGGIVWDTNQFPSGMPWVASWLHTNGWNLELGQYYQGGYSNQVSMIEGGSASYVMLTASTIQRDIARIHSWGVDGFTAEDSSLASGYQQQMMLQLSAACVAPGGFVFNDVTEQPYPNPMSSRVLIQNPPNPNWAGWVNDVANDGISYLPPSAALSSQFLIDTWNFRVDWTNYVPGTSRGHYVEVGSFNGGGDDPVIGDAHIVLSSAAMMFASLGFWGATNDSISASFSNSVLSNTKWISVWHDPMFAHVQKVYDGGILTTSVWSRALSTGGSAVLMVNETYTQPMSVQFSALGMSPALTTFDVFDCWSNQDLGNFNGGFTNSIPIQDCGLYVVTPVSTGGGGGSSALPASTNSIWNLTNAANTFSGNGGGLTNIYVSSLVISTNAAPQTNTIVGFFWLTNGVNVYKIPVLQ